tara:strand:- start:76 stop:264 length:189 start_codon:yes stop_codon:yes gene_type:complete
MKLLKIKDLVTYKGKDMKFVRMENKGKGEIYVVLSSGKGRDSKLKLNTVEKLLDKKELVVYE